MRRAAAVSLLVLPSTALAITTGGLFSGPALPSGSSLYWNPAALVRDAAPWALHVELTGIVAEPRYRREGTDPATGEPYEETSFLLVAPDLSLAASADTPLSWLRIAAGAFSPYAVGSAWPDDSPARYFATDSYVVSYAAAAGVTVELHRALAVALLVGPVYTALELDSSFDYGAFANSRLEPGAELFRQEDPMLEGKLQLRAAGWSPMAIAGVQAAPLEWLRIGLGALLPRAAQLSGGMRVLPPPSFDTAIPGARIEPRGRLSLRYPLPLRLHGEIEGEAAGLTVALGGAYSPGKPRRVIYPTVSEAEPNFLEGRQLSVRGVRDDWAVGVRCAVAAGEALELGARVDYEPRSIPSETLTPVNFDLSSLEAAAGARWQASPTLELSTTLAYRWHFETVVGNSLFNPRAPPDSGLNQPSGNGSYDAWALRLVIGVAWRPAS